jgi:hypothetical protein
MAEHKKITVNDKMQQGYTYVLTEPAGRNFDDDFKPELTPKEMLELGVFGGRYLRDCTDEFPESWFAHARFAEDKSDPKLNFFEVKASQSLAEWRRKGWIYDEDPRGWFQWYCRYYMGRRIPEEDKRQIKRWKNMTRHIGQVKKYCRPGELDCRRGQRQALLHWAYDSRKM